MQTQESTSFFEAVAIMLGSTIGAGILAIPFAVSRVGWTVGMIYIITLGLIMMSLNLMVGEIALRTKTPMQVTGMAGRYLGGKGKVIMSIINFLSGFGAMVAYLVGEGQILQSFLGGDSFVWSLVFWCLGATLVFFGLSLVKKVDVLLTLIILTVVLVIVFVSTPAITLPNLSNVSFANLFFPFGVILFAFQGASGVPQVGVIMSHKQKRMKEAIVVAGVIVIIAYLLFMTAVVGVTGSGTTEIATFGLGQKLGKSVLLLVDLFAFFAMGTGFLNLSIAIRNAFRWDFEMSRPRAWFLTMFIPLSLFIIGIRSFIEILDFVGGVFGAIFAILIILIYWRARVVGDLPASRYRLHYASFLSVIIIIVFVIASLYGLFSKLGVKLF